MFTKKNKFASIILLFIACSFFVSQIAQAALPPLVPECAQGATTDLNCFIEVFTNAAQIMLGLLGSLALLMFVYGGFLMITAGEEIITEGGKSSKINKGKKVLTGAVIGIIIVLGAWMMINYASKQLLKPEYKEEMEQYMPEKSQ